MPKRLTVFLVFTATLALLADKVSDIVSALDISNGITIINATGTITKETKYSNDHIGNWDTGKKETVYASKGVYFLKMKGGSKSNSEARSSRIVSSFTFTVQGAGALTFQHRVATYSNDDVLVFYEDDINTPLLELGGEYWRKKESWDGDVYFDLYAEDFWVEDTVDMSVDRYNHTIKVALLAPYNGESYWDKDSDEIVENCAWLDDFVWEPDNDMVICGFDTPENVTEFDGKGLEVTIYSNYESEGKLVLEYWYTIDGSTPVKNGATSRKYDEETGIVLPGTLSPGNVTVKVVAYDGATQVGGVFSQTYIRKQTVGTPVVASASQVLFTPEITITLGCEPAYDDVAYYYTTDGTEPTTASQKAEGNSIQVTKPSTVKVIAFADQEQSPETLAVTITQAMPPTCTIKADGGNSGNLVFQTQCVVTAQAPGGAKVHYRENGGEAAVYSSARTVTSTTTLEFVTAGTVDSASGVYQLNSVPVAVTMTKETANDGAWATTQVEQFAPDGWSLFAVPRHLSDKRSAELIAWLHPFAYNASKRTLERATTLQGGASYLVHSSMIVAKKRPTTFADGGAAEPLTGDGSHWVLSSEGAEMIWNGMTWLNPPTETPDLPGWRR
ncbi:MAG: chitobiase/beta-hexosaminidase C-terminal domain-containing protein [Victivallales bacterium]|nr:chitobiase/beta-hexosaminidase C-terminal domain-containing protein [Victivallales bacterium]